VAFTPSALLKRLFETGSADSATRVAFWRESVPIVAHFPVFGVGLMGFESTFLRYQDVLLTKRVDFAHNDYLQYLIELGAAGFALAVVALAAVLWPAIKGAWSSHDTRSRVWLTGCIASFVELALHSAVDFNLYVPANLLAFAWIAAFASVIASGPARLQPTHPA
jgi:O-antigen ligase